MLGREMEDEDIDDPNVVTGVIHFMASNFVPEGSLRDKGQSSVSEDEEGEECTPLFIDQDPNEVYRNLQKIGEGGMGVVYQANGPRGELVALKSLDVSLEKTLSSVQHEVRMMKSCSHKNIVEYYKSYIWKGYLWVCMEHMNGGSLTEIISICKMTEPQIACVCSAVLQGLHYLHSFNRIHRDIKSDNILLTVEGTIKLADFGLLLLLSILFVYFFPAIFFPFFFIFFY